MIINSTLHIGGAEQVAASLARHVRRDQFDVRACYLKEPGLIADQMASAGVDLVPLPGLKEGSRDYWSPFKLRRLIGSGRNTVIHSHDLHGLIAGSVCRMTLRGLKHVHTFHAGHYPRIDARHRIIEAVHWRVPDVLVAVGRSQARLISKFHGIPADRIRIIWNGVEDPLSQPPAAPLEFDIPADTPIIASISTLIPQKGLSHLLEAAALLRQSGERFLLLIAGDGRLRGELIAQSQRLDLSGYVRFLGWVPQASATLLPKCDIFVQSSLWEAMSVVVLEAMAHGKAIVATEVGENPDVIQHERSGMLVPPGSPDLLAGALRQMLNDAVFRARLGHAARQCYEQQFTVTRMAGSYEAVYREVLGAPP